MTINDLKKKFRNVDALNLYFDRKRSCYISSACTLYKNNDSDHIEWKDLFETLGIKPQQLRSIFHLQWSFVSKVQRRWFLPNKVTKSYNVIEISDEIHTFGELGFLRHYDNDALKKLSQLLGKKLNIHRTMEHIYDIVDTNIYNSSFVLEHIVTPDGKIIEPTV